MENDAYFWITDEVSQYTMHASHEIIQIEGFRVLFRGVTANVLLGVAGLECLQGMINFIELHIRVDISLSHIKRH